MISIWGALEVIPLSTILIAIFLALHQDLLGLHQRPPHVRLLPPGQRLGVVLAPGRRTGHGAGRRLRAALCADLAGRVGRRLLPLGLLVDRRGRPSRLPLLLCTR